MKCKLKAAASAILAASLICSSAYAADPPAPAKKKAVAKKPPKPTVEEQIQSLRQEFQGQIDSLKSDLAAKDTQLKQAQQTASDAQAAAAKAQSALDQQQTAVTENTAAVSSLQGSVTDLKANAVSLATTVSDETSNIKKAINSPTTLHYKGVNLTPGGYLAGETVWRSKATGADIPTPFNALPYEHADAYKLSEFYGSARQSRIALMMEGKPDWGTLRGYYEADWLGTGVSSNDNQSNSYVMRQRVLWAQAETHSHWAFSGGQMWSLATEVKKGMSTLPSDIMTPQTIDPNYVAGFVWERQWGFRVTKTGKIASFGFGVENPQVLYTATLAGNTPYAVLGSAGNNGGAYNAAISSSVPTTYIQNYAPNGSTGYIPVYNTIFANTNIANYSFNVAPDLILKVALDPKWGHYEVFGIGRWAHEEIYPGVTTDSTKYGGQKDVETGAAVVAAATTAGAYNNKISLGGVGGSFRVPFANNKVSFGVKGLYGPGMGRYGDSGLADVTANYFGGLSPIHNTSGLGTLEFNPNPRLLVYINYGIDYASRVDWSRSTTTTLGGPTATFCPTGFTSPSQCTAKPTAAQLAAGGTWGGHWGAPGAAAVGYGSRLTSNSGCLTNTLPGYNGASTGFYPGGSCGDQTRDVQEITAGWWYDIYRGEHGRFRQGFQYGYAGRYGWSGVGGFQAKGFNNMFWTSFRYYIP